MKIKKSIVKVGTIPCKYIPGKTLINKALISFFLPEIEPKQLEPKKWYWSYKLGEPEEWKVFQFEEFYRFGLTQYWDNNMIKFYGPIPRPK